MNKFKATMLMVAGSMGVIGFAGAASAADVSADVPQIVVHYTPGSLESDGGAQALYAKLVVAAERVCADQPQEGKLPSKAVLSCRKQALDGALERIHNTRLAAVAVNSKRV